MLYCLDLPITGTASPESKCKLVKTKLEPKTLTIKITGSIVKYHCTSKVTRCSGNCLYCDEGCVSVHSKMEKPIYNCVTMDPNPHIVLKQLYLRDREPVQIDKECKCLGKYDVGSGN